MANAPKLSDFLGKRVYVCCARNGVTGTLVDVQENGDLVVLSDTRHVFIYGTAIQYVRPAMASEADAER